jgi:hypothetical protein
MKIIFMIILLHTAHCLLPTDCQAQTFNEWFRQKKTQRKYLIEQIAALKVYLSKLKKGYEIAQKGLNTISNIKDGNFNLHRDFFGSLKNVNPAISNSAKVADIIAFQIYITRDMKRVYDFCKTNDSFTPEEVRYIAKVHSNLLFLCDASLSELLTIIRTNETEMTDDERLLRINKVYDDMQDKRAFVHAFGDDTQMLAYEREKEKHETELLRKHFEIL